MIFRETTLPGAYIIEPERLQDGRGFFARTFCKAEFDAHGLNGNVTQCNISFNEVRGTLRGLHYQAKPRQEVKLVRCTSGAIFDVIVDLRPNSTTFKRWVSVELSAQNRLMLYVAEGFAHGFQTLQNNVEVFYQMSEFYAPAHRRGVRWDDPELKIEWPLAPSVISAKDKTYPFLKEISEL